MPIKVKHKNLEWCTIRPTPLISMSANVLKTGGSEAFGVTYQITLTGKLLANQGSPYAANMLGARNTYASGVTPNSVGPYGAFDNNTSHFHDAEQDRPTPQLVSSEEALSAILFKQKAIRGLFEKDFYEVEITDWNDDSATAVRFFPRVISVDFAEGIYVDTCDYTIVLEADTLLDANNKVDTEASVAALQGGGIHKTEKEILEDFDGAFINSFSEDWSIEIDESFGETKNSDLNIYMPQAYRITRNLTCTGKSHYEPQETKTYEAWEMARKFVTDKLKKEETEYATDPHSYYPNTGHTALMVPLRNLASGTMDLIENYRGYNHARTEQIGKSEGNFSITESWLLATGNTYENYQMSLTNSLDTPFIDISINGTIKGLTSKKQKDYSGEDTSGGHVLSDGGRFKRAIGKYYEISNSGLFGVGCDVYKRANNSVAVELNSQPKSVTLGTNEFTGEITYSLSFDNRPTNIISGVLAEQISVNDTYPGDVIAVIPVLGRKTGPVLQYMGGRTEYTRDVRINLVMDYTKLPYGKTRDPLILKKPSIVNPTATQIQQLLLELSPSNEPGIRKYFLATPPSESWSPKDGNYSINMSWVYELDK